MAKAKKVQVNSNSTREIEVKYNDVVIYRNGKKCIQRFIGLSKADEFGFKKPLWEVVEVDNELDELLDVTISELDSK